MDISVSRCTALWCHEIHEQHFVSWRSIVCTGCIFLFYRAQQRSWATGGETERRYVTSSLAALYDPAWSKVPERTRGTCAVLECTWNLHRGLKILLSAWVIKDRQKIWSASVRERPLLSIPSLCEQKYLEEQGALFCAVLTSYDASYLASKKIDLRINT